MQHPSPPNNKHSRVALVALLVIVLLVAVAHVPRPWWERMAALVALPTAAHATVEASKPVLPPPGPPPYTEFISCTRKDAHVNNKASVGSFMVNTNVWNPKAADFFEACVRAKHHTAADTVDAELTWDVKKSRNQVLSYPNLSHGWQVGTHQGSTTPRLPAIASSMPELRATGTVESRCDGDSHNKCLMNTAFELLFTDSSHPTTWPPKSEIMVWVQATCRHCNAGRLVDTINIDGIDWEVYKGMVKPPVDIHEWTYVAYVAKQTVTTIDLNFKRFVQDSIARGYVMPTEYLAVIELGTEITAGKGQTTVRDLRIR